MLPLLPPFQTRPTRRAWCSPARSPATATAPSTGSSTVDRGTVACLVKDQCARESGRRFMSLVGNGCSTTGTRARGETVLGVASRAVSTQRWCERSGLRACAHRAGGRPGHDRRRRRPRSSPGRRVRTRSALGAKWPLQPPTILGEGAPLRRRRAPSRSTRCPCRPTATAATVVHCRGRPPSGATPDAQPLHGCGVVPLGPLSDRTRRLRAVTATRTADRHHGLSQWIRGSGWCDIHRPRSLSCR